MTAAIDLATWAVALPPALVTVVAVVELFAAHWPGRPARAAAASPGPRIVVLIPAHDEAGVIAATIAGIRATAPDDIRLLVVADNCSDDTAAIARATGAEVIKRHDPERRGKGFALACGRDHLAADPPDVVVIVDADCTVPGDGIIRLAQTAQDIRRPVQSTYLLHPQRERGPIGALAGFAFLVRNLVRQRGLEQLGAPALLTGSGMAFSWHLFGDAPLATDDLVEDLTLGINFTRAGTAPVFLADVRTWSEPARSGAVYTQRVRWEQGYLRCALRNAPPLLASGRWPAFWLGLHLLVPPLALLLAIDGLVLLLLFAVVGQGASQGPVLLLLVPTLLMVALILVSWARYGREQITAAQLLLAPLYVAWKLPIYLAAIVRPERRWRRTDRS